MNDSAGALAGQAALVTGTSSGIGQAIAVSMAAAGAAVAVNYRSSAEGAEETCRRITEAGGTAFAIKGDVSRQEDVEAMVQETIDRFGTVDILAANAGIQKDKAFLDMTVEDWRKVLEVNLTGQFLCSQAVTREFLHRGVVPEISRAAGKIILIRSVHDTIPWAGRVNYAASKGGSRLLMPGLAQELAPRRIRVNGIAPGAIKTATNTESWETEEAARKTLQTIPYGRIG